MSTFQLNCPNCGLTTAGGHTHCPGCGSELAGALEARGAGPARAPVVGVPWTVGQIAVGLFLFLAVLLAAAFVARAVGPLYPEYESALETLVAVHLVGVGVALVVWFMGLRLADSAVAAIGLNRPRTSLPWSALLVVVALIFSIGATFLYGLVIDRLGLEALRPPDINSQAFFPGVGILLTLQALAVVTPLSEEVLFRGFVLRGLLFRIGTGPAIVSTALVFSAFHLDLGTMVPIFFTGLALGWLHVKTGSLWPCVAAHAGQNAIALLAVRAGL